MNQVHVENRAYDSGEVATLLGIPGRTIRRYLAQGRLRGVQHPITRRWLISREEILQFLEANGIDVQPAKEQSAP